MMGNKKGITLLALVITIVIILLLAGITLQVAMGENGLIAKSEQAKKEQAKTELYDTVKSSYAALSLRAIRNDKDKPNVEEVFNTADFTDRYNIVGDNITDKKGTIIDTKANVLNLIQGTVAGGFTPGTSTPAESWPKTVGGVTIPEEDKDKMILKLKVPGSESKFVLQGNAEKVDYGNYEGIEEVNAYWGKQLKYNQGEYVLKISGFENISILAIQEDNTEIEILQWGKFNELPDEQNSIRLDNVSKIYEPEPDKITVCYNKANFSEIPEWLFSKKVTSKKMSYFLACEKITRIPENLFKNCVNAEEFYSTFSGSRITEIPEDIFKYNTKAKLWVSTFGECTGLTSIPENLFKYNIESTYFGSVFAECTGLTSIPEDLFRHNTKIEEIRSIFYQCTGLRNIPENLFKYNTEMRKLTLIFYNCTGLTSIPENLFKYNVNVVDFERAFYNCTGLTSIPENLFKYNVNVINFESTFYNCTGLTNIPERLFDYNTSAKKFRSTFSECTRLRHIPDKIIEIAKRVKENLEFVRYMFKNCTSASNYSSIPDYMK